MRVSRTPFRTAALASCAALALSWSAPSQAQAAAAAEFEIEAQDLGPALSEFARQSRVPLLFSPDLVAGKRGNSINGEMAPLSALAQLIEGSDLTFTVTDSDAILLVRADADAEERDPQGRLVLAQATSTDADENQTDDEPDVTADETGDRIVVTGSRLRNAAFTSELPVQVLDAQAAELIGVSNTAELIRRSSLLTGSPQTDTKLGALGPGGRTGLGGAGVNSISLRGLGAQRTLVLLNGRRLNPAGVRGDVGPVDINVLPSSIIDRVEILKDGASSVYGSDAIAGVVNNITYTNLDGGLVTAYGNVPVDGGAERYSIAGGWGREYDRGYLNLAFQYDRQERLRNKERDFLACAEDYVFDPETGERVDLLDTNGDFKCRSHNPNGAFFSYDWFGGTFIPDPNGDLIGLPGDTTRADLPGWARVGNFTIGDSAAVRESYAVRPESSLGYENADAISPNALTSVFASGAYELTDSIEIYGQALLNRRDSEFDSWYFLYQYMSPNNPNNTVADGLIAASGGGSAGSIAYQLVRPYNSSQDIDYYNLVGGLRGKVAGGGLFGGWEWDVYGQVGRSDATYSSTFLYENRLNAISFGDVPCDGAVLANVADPLVGVETPDLCDGVDIPVLSTRFLVDQDWTPEELAFLEGRETGSTTYDQWLIEGTFGGDLFELPAGPVSTVVGFHYRYDEIDDTPGLNEQAGNYHLFSTAGITRGDATVTELFGEFGAPLVRDVPLVEKLDVLGSVRWTDHSEYDSSATYKVGVNWSPVAPLTLRASYGTSYRAPQLFELFLADSTGFEFINDPCRMWADSTSAILQANCESLGIPDDFTPNVSDLLVTTGGGAGVLNEETSNALTAGFVWRPDFADLAIAVDYFEIEVNDEIASLSANQIVSECYLSPDFPNNPFCELVEPRDAANQLTGVNARLINLNSQTNSGVDVTARYGRSIGAADLNVNAQFTYQLDDTISFFGEEALDRLGNFGRPQISGFTDIELHRGAWDGVWSVQVIGESGWPNYYTSDQFNFFGPYNGDLLQEKLKTELTVYHHASVRLNIDSLTLQLGVQNMFDEDPPNVSVDARFGASRTGTAAMNNWDIRGRRIFFRATKRF